MLKIENVEIHGLEPAIRGMRNPMNSWDRSDSYKTHIEDPTTLETADFQFFVGDNDKELMVKLAKGGPVHAKYRRMIVVYMDITAPLYWWKEFDTYKVGTVANSCSTMHKIHSKEFTIDDFSHEHLIPAHRRILEETIEALNESRKWFLDYDHMSEKDKKFFVEGINCKKDIWWQMIQLLPSSYNQRRTVMLNYEVLANIYESRRGHKLGEWQVLCDRIEDLPHSDIITGDYL